MNHELAYLKAFIEGEAGLQPWGGWCEQHRPALERLLSRGQFLRLKFSPFVEIPKILRDHGLTFIPSDYYQWPHWDETGPTGAPRLAPTSKHIATVLNKFQQMLCELHVFSLNPGESGFDEPPSDLYVSQTACRTFGWAPPTVLAAWLVDLDEIRPIHINAPEPEAEADGSFFRHGYGLFSFTPDSKKVFWGWQVGPLFGHCSIYDVVQSSAGAFCLINERLRTIS